MCIFFQSTDNTEEDRVIDILQNETEEKKKLKEKKKAQWTLGQLQVAKYIRNCRPQREGVRKSSWRNKGKKFQILWKA